MDYPGPFEDWLCTEQIGSSPRRCREEREESYRECDEMNWALDWLNEALLNCIMVQARKREWEIIQYVLRDGGDVYHFDYFIYRRSPSGGVAAEVGNRLRRKIKYPSPISYGVLLGRTSPDGAYTTAPELRPGRTAVREEAYEWMFGRESLHWPLVRSTWSVTACNRTNLPIEFQIKRFSFHSENLASPEYPLDLLYICIETQLQFPEATDHHGWPHQS